MLDVCYTLDPPLLISPIILLYIMAPHFPAVKKAAESITSINPPVLPENEEDQTIQSFSTLFRMKGQIVKLTTQQHVLITNQFILKPWMKS